MTAPGDEQDWLAEHELFVLVVTSLNEGQPVEKVLADLDAALPSACARPNTLAD